VSVVRRSSANVCYVLREDPELADAIQPDRRDRAIATCVAREVRIPVGPWDREQSVLEDGIGLLVLQGLLIHRVGINARFGAELLGEGDVLRPWRDEAEASTLPLTIDWQVLEPARVAVLDERFTRELAHYPQLAGRLFARAVQRARQMTVNMAIVHQARVDVRLHMLLWHLAGRWGKVRTDGIVVPLRLTHTVLSDLVAARRPTVTSALSDLARRGEVQVVDEGWLLAGDPPCELTKGS
jgi:CRP/FNR family transcriptional regulator, cyclic AMP receptor protein